MEHLTMSRKERERLRVFGRIKAGELPRKQAAGILGLSLRQVHRPTDVTRSAFRLDFSPGTDYLT